MIDAYDVDRIQDSLDRAGDSLRAIPHQARFSTPLDKSEHLPLFEALCCTAFLENPHLVQKHFDGVFALVQERSSLQNDHYLPGITTLLFDIDPTKSTWARKTWAQHNGLLTLASFDFAVREPLSHQLILAQNALSEPDFIERFWQALKNVVDKLDRNLITHALRAMDVDVIRLSLDHLQCDSSGLRYLLQTTNRLLEIAPIDYWESMGAIPPMTLIEQVFNCPHYDRVLLDAAEDEDFESSSLGDMLTWVRPLMASLQIGHQAQACRALSFHLLDRLQTDRFPAHARVECFRVGLGALKWALLTCNTDKGPGSVGRIVSSEALEVLSSYIERILEVASNKRHAYHDKLAGKCIPVIKLAVALECKSIRTDHEALRMGLDLPSGFSACHPTICDTVIRCLKPGNILIARAALGGINDLTGLMKFRVDSSEKHFTEKSDFNRAFSRFTHIVCQMLERVNDFDASDLDELFRHESTATALISSLFSPDPSTYEAGVELTKTVSSESARPEAIAHLFKPFFATTLNAISLSTRRIARSKSFSSCPRMLTTCQDVLGILCDSQSGLLRTRLPAEDDKIEPLNREAIESFWHWQWEALRTIYEKTEDWGREKVSDSSTLKEFCRDTMQFSDRLFDQFTVFASSFETNGIVKKEDPDAGSSEIGNINEKLLGHPSKTMLAMVKWLRLRDLYLAETSMKLTKKILDRLTVHSMVLDHSTCEFLTLVIQNGPQGKTHLTPQEKAELSRSLQANTGRPIPPIIVNVDDDSDSLSNKSAPRTHPAGKKPIQKLSSGTIDIDSWRSKAKAPRAFEVSDESEDTEENDKISIVPSIEDLRRARAARAADKSKATEKAKTISSAGRFSNLHQTAVKSQADSLSFREKREKEKEEKKKRDAEALALIKKRAVVPKGIAGQTLEEGSGVNGIGFKGKDHAPKGSGIMLSSDSESDSDSAGELDQELFGMQSKPSKVSDSIRDQNSRVATLMPAIAKGPVKKIRQLRSANDMRARLAPDLTALHKTILSWDFFHSGDFPIGTGAKDYAMVTNTFRDPIHYRTTFEPLLILEAWQGFLKSKEEGNFKVFEIKIANRMSVNTFVEVSTSMTMIEGKDLGIGEADIVLLSKSETPVSDSKIPHCLARVTRIIRKKGVMEISYQVCVDNKDIHFLAPNTAIYGVKILSVTPLEREYGALEGLKYYDLCDEITKAKPSPLLAYSEKQLGPLVSNYRINNAQAKAVRSAVDNDAFTLIQG